MAQRGKLLTYDAATGKGMVALIDRADGARLAFTIEAWQSAELPRAGMVVDVVDANADAASPFGFRPVLEADLMKERIGSFGQQLSQTVGRTLASDGAQQAAARAVSIKARLGVPVLAGYAVYAGATVFANFATVRVMGMGGGATLYELSTVLARAGGSGALNFLLWLSWLSLAVPVFWTARKAWLAHCLPLATVLLCLYSVYRSVSDMQAQMGRLLGSGNLPGLSDFLSFGAGFYLCLLAGLGLAIHAILAAKRNA